MICEVVWISYIIFPILMALGIISLFKIRRDYRVLKQRTRKAAISISIFYELYIVLIIYISWCGLWPFPVAYVGAIISIVAGICMLVLGCIFYVIAIREFNTFKRTLGLKANKLINTGLYGWCRNPQTFFWAIAQFGMALMGRSFFALLLGVIWCIYIHIYTLVEEQFLESIFGDEYHNYCDETPRYFRFGKA